MFFSLNKHKTMFEENNPILEIPPECESTSSSDSYSYLFQDLENPENTVTDEWDAIERTLYQENGKQVINPALLKECRLWNETFPHLRIRGTQIQDKRIEKGVGPETRATKCVQTTNTQPSWVKLNEQRESIKKQVVCQLVQRLISKFNLSKENSTGVLQYFDKMDLEKKEKEQKEKKIVSNVPISHKKIDTNYYFERGKSKNEEDTNQKVSIRENNFERNHQNDSKCDMSDNLEKEFNVRFLSNSMLNEKNNLLKSLKIPSTNEQKLPKKNLINESKSEVIPYELKKEIILKKEKKALKIAETIIDSKIKNDWSSPLDSLSSLSKPFEATKKIDKKYEILLESILKNKGLNFSDSNATNNKYEILKPEKKSCKEPTEKLRTSTNYDEYLKRHKQLPKINNFTNNWISRTDNSFKEYNTAMEEFKKEQPIRSTKVSSSSSSLKIPSNNWLSKSVSSTEANKKNDFKTENLKSNENSKSVVDIHNNKGEKLKPFLRSNKSVVPKSYKSSSCGDLHNRKLASSNLSERNMKSGFEQRRNDAVCKSTSRTNPDRRKTTSKTTCNIDMNLPQIKSGIIVTELNCRPKITTRIQPRKYS